MLQHKKLQSGWRPVLDRDIPQVQKVGLLTVTSNIHINFTVTAHGFTLMLQISFAKTLQLI